MTLRRNYCTLSQVPDFRMLHILEGFVLLKFREIGSMTIGGQCVSATGQALTRKDAKQQVAQQLLKKIHPMVLSLLSDPLFSLIFFVLDWNMERVDD